MLKFAGLLAVISVAFTVWCLVEAISTDGHRVRRLPKAAWIVLIVLLPLVGSIAWLRLGRPQVEAVDPSAAQGPDRTKSADARNPAEEAADFSTRIRERAEEQRRRYEQQKKTEKPEPDTEQP